MIYDAKKKKYIHIGVFYTILRLENNESYLKLFKVLDKMFEWTNISS